jgi:hypothetical protein
MESAAPTSKVQFGHFFIFFFMRACSVFFFVMIGVNTAMGMYLNEFLIKGDGSADTTPDKGINLIKKVIIPHKIIEVQIMI